MGQQVAQIIDSDTGEVLGELFPEDKNETCYGYQSGCTSELCGGCDGCLLMQAHHYGSKIKWVDESQSLTFQHKAKDTLNDDGTKSPDTGNPM